jgi:hypothetical protein
VLSDKYKVLQLTYKNTQVVLYTNLINKKKKRKQKTKVEDNKDPMLENEQIIN